MPKQRELIYHVLLYCHNMQYVGVFSSVGLLETLTRLYNNHACALRGQIHTLICAAIIQKLADGHSSECKRSEDSKAI